MDETERYIKALLQQNGIGIDQTFEHLFRTFVNLEENEQNVNHIKLLQENMIKNWKVMARKAEIDSLQLMFPNGIQGKPYHASFALEAHCLADVVSYRLTGFEDSGLVFDANKGIITGTPLAGGDISLNFSYRLEGELPDAGLNHKKITIIINPDPKLLWKNLPSDGAARFAKADVKAETSSFLGHTLLAASKRGRSHANKGGFREDDYAFATLVDGWGVIAISDGAGSATLSRKGSALACESVIDYFNSNFTAETIELLNEAVSLYPSNYAMKEKLLRVAIPHLSAAAKHAHLAIAELAKDTDVPISEFHATLAFVLVKESDQGCAFLSFSVGDCPISLVDRSFEWVKPLNTLDVGEYGGGTRFITMADLFEKANFEARFSFEWTGKFPNLVLMSDGIYDSKFEVEANLVKPERWQDFFSDLRGNNEGEIKVLGAEADSDKKLVDWMDFWSAGNHDDRTLIILF